MFGTEYSGAFPPAHNYLYGVEKNEKLREMRREKEEEEEEGTSGKGLNSSVEWRRP